MHREEMIKRLAEMQDFIDNFECVCPEDVEELDNLEKLINLLVKELDNFPAVH